MKIRHFIGLVLVLVGTNLFTFASSRYWTTRHVLTRAHARMDAALKIVGHEELTYPAVNDASDRQAVILLLRAVTLAGGAYYWWNDAIVYWLAGVLLALTGIGFISSEPQKKPSA